MPVTLSKSCCVTGTRTSGVKKKYSVEPSGVMNGESSAPAVFIVEGSDTGCSNSLLCSTGGDRSVVGVIFTASFGIVLSRVGAAVMPLLLSSLPFVPVLAGVVLVHAAIRAISISAKSMHKFLERVVGKSGVMVFLSCISFFIKIVKPPVNA